MALTRALAVSVLLVWGGEVCGQTATVTGRVIDEHGVGFPFASVVVQGTFAGTVTEEDGTFSFEASALGTATIEATMVGFEPATARVTLAAGDTVTVELALLETILSLGSLEVSASAYTTADGTEATLSALDVVMTPGASADVFRAVQTFAGVTQVNEGSGLYVRGGDATETRMLLDLAPLHHPYKYESPTTVVSGTIPPFLLKGTSFAAGGFSAKYGNALSAVLDMRTQDRPQASNYYVNAGLGAVSLGVDVPVPGDRFGVRISGNRSLSGLMFRVNGESADFEEIPTSLDGNVSLSYAYAPDATVKLFSYAATDRLGVRTDDPTFTGIYRGEQANRFHTLYWTDILGDWQAEASASYGRQSSRQTFGALDLTPSDETYAIRVDAERAPVGGIEWAVGAETQRIWEGVTGTIPTSEETGPDAPSATINFEESTVLAGAYAEATARPLRRLAVRAGARVDAHTLSGTAVVDPRLAARYALADGLDLRAAWGIYHQYVSPEIYSTNATLDLAPQRAQHFIVGLEHERDHLHLRAEGYVKPYDRLLIADETGAVVDDGDGWARGLDLFVKYGAFLQTRVHGHASYSFVQARRLQVRSLGETSAIESGPAPFDVTHNLTVVGKVQLVGGLSAGTTVRYATGQPYTPVVGAVLDESGTYYHPIQGAVGSERLPAFARVDAQLIYYLPFGQNNVVFYGSVGNLFDRDNAFGIEYSPDYSEATIQKTEFHRFFYLGVTVNIAG